MFVFVVFICWNKVREIFEIGAIFIEDVHFVLTVYIYRWSRFDW